MTLEVTGEWRLESGDWRVETGEWIQPLHSSQSVTHLAQ